LESVAEARKRQRGTKRLCHACEQKFYDLGRAPIVCPLCLASLSLEALARQSKIAKTVGYTGRGAFGFRRAPEFWIVAADAADPEAVDSAEVESGADGGIADSEDEDAVLETEDDDGVLDDIVEPGASETPGD
jgi:uncharacterized protein (TIGR02300 family)